VLTKDDYEGYFRKHEPFVAALSGDLTAKTFLFPGFSFSDPNIDYVKSRVRVTLHHAPKQHYCIMRREQKKAREKNADFEYRTHQQHRSCSLRSFRWAFARLEPLSPTTSQC